MVEQSTQSKPHPRQALAAVAIGKLEPGKYADGLGLYLVVDESGARRWVLRLTINGKRRELGLGGFPIVSLAMAREETLHLKGVARKGGDPEAERNRETRTIPTFEQCTAQVHTEHSTGWRNKKHSQQWINTLTKYAYPAIGRMRVDQVGTADVLKVLLPIWTEKPETARRLRQRIRVVLDCAKAKEYRSGDNPTETIGRVLPKQPDNKQHHKALPYTKVPQFITELRQIKAEPVSRLAFEFLILTATRTNEAIKARWPEVDLKARTWTIPAERMKAKREHCVPLPARCIAILSETLKHSDGMGYIFPGRGKDKPLSQMVFLMALRRMEYDVTAHGFRSCFRDWAAERTNISRDVCEAALAHTIRDKTEAAYNRTTLLDKRRDLMAQWSAFAEQQHGKVIKLKSA